MELDRKLTELESMLEDIRDRLPLSSRFRREYVRQVKVKMSALPSRTTEPYPDQGLEDEHTNPDQELSKE